MAEEIEHKFLVANEGWKAHVLHHGEGKQIHQGYIGLGKKKNIAITIEGDHAVLRLEKGDIVHHVPIPKEEALEIKALFQFDGHVLAEGEHQHARVRIVTSEREGVKGYLTLKAKGKNDTIRSEFEYEIPPATAKDIFAEFTKHAIDKTRYDVKGPDGKTWEVDVYEGPHHGLVTAEIELSREGEPFQRPRWVGAEITQNKEFSNRAMAKSGTIPKTDGIAFT